MKNVNRFVNFRPFLFCFLSASAGMELSRIILNNGVSPLFLLSVFPVCLFLFWQSRNKKRTTAYILFMLVSFFVACLFYFLRYYSFFAHLPFSGEYQVSGVVKTMSPTANGFYCTIEQVLLDGEQLKGNLIFFTHNKIEEGVSVSFFGKIYSNAENFPPYYRLRNILCQAQLLSPVEIVKVNFSFFGSIRSSLYTVLFSSMKSDHAAISYALLTGDLSEIQSELLTNVRYGGIAHVFAVSGIHVGAVYTLCDGVLRKIHLPKLLVFFITATLAFFYIGICGFSPSAVRAFIMALVLDLSFWLDYGDDFCEALGFSGLVLYALDPFYIESVGFVLSFVSCFALAFLFPVFRRTLAKVKVKGKIADAFSASVSVNLVLFPVLLDCFSYVSFSGIFLNVFIVPVFTGLLVLLFPLALLSALLPFMGKVLLFVPNVLLYPVSFFLSVTDFSFFTLSGFSFGTAIFAYYSALFFISDKIKLSRRNKIALALFFLSLTVFAISLNPM